MNRNPFDQLIAMLEMSRGRLFGLLILGALLAFEVFNFSTTEFALHDLLGDLHFMGMRWSMILSIAFCGIDFAGVARLFTPEKGADEPLEVWYLFGAWLLAAAMNAMLTWWGVSIAILNNETLGNAVVARDTMLKVVPIFVAILVWLVRVLVIGTFSVAGERLFTQDDSRPARLPLPSAGQNRSLGRTPAPVAPRAAPAASFTPATGRGAQRAPTFREQPAAPHAVNEPQPTYHPVEEEGGYTPPRGQRRNF